MDSFNRTAAHLRELFETMTPSARILAGLLLAVVVTSLGVMYPSNADAPEEVLFSGDNLSDSQLNRMEVAIAQAGLAGHRREGGQIWVPAEQKAAYLAAVADADALPPNFNSMLERALDRGGPLDSREATRERMKIAKQQTLSEIVRAMHWVEDAVVLTDEQEPHGLSGKRQVIGSVSVKPKRGESLDQRRTHTLQTLVAHAVVGLRPEDVAVTNLGEGGDSGSDAGVSPGAIDSGYSSACSAYEQLTRQSILNALCDIPGVRVEVNAEPADATGETACDQTSDERATVDDASANPKSTPSATPSALRPSTFAQGPSRPLDTEDAAVQTASDATQVTCEVEGVAADDRGTPWRSGFMLGQVRVTVTIPHDYVERIWQQRHLGSLRQPSEADLRNVQDGVIAKVESIVEPLLPRLEGNVLAVKPVRVVVLDSVSTTPATPATLSNQAWTWASSHGSTLAVLGMATIGLLTLHRVFPPARENNDAANSSEFNIQDSLATVETGTPASEPQGLLRFDDLTRVDDATLAAVIQEVEPDVMALALTGAKDELMERIMGQIPRQVAKTFRQQLTRLGPTRLRDVEAAQQLVAAAAARRLDPTHPVRRAA